MGEAKVRYVVQVDGGRGWGWWRDVVGGPHKTEAEARAEMEDFRLATPMPGVKFRLVKRTITEEVLDES